MKKKSEIKFHKSAGRGPIARKVIASAQRVLESKLTYLADWRDGKIRAEELNKTIIAPNKLTGYDPAHALYIYAQNQLSVLVEQIAELPMLEKLSDAYATAEEEYMPYGPPASPLTKSYFTCWGFFDLCSGGAKKETLATVAIDLCKALKVDEGLIDLFEKMQASRMGIYRFEGASGKHVHLTEFITEKPVTALSTSGYRGHPHEIWLARILPPPLADDKFDYSVIFTTPYILGKTGNRGDFIPFVEQDWLDYFERNLTKTKIDDRKSAYEHLMKYGLSKNYWNEYIFLSYWNHSSDMILAKGVPDIRASLPQID